jgi:hypothetical protein
LKKITKDAASLYEQTQKGEVEHSSIGLDIEIDAPVIIVPQNIFVDNVPYL